MLRRHIRSCSTGSDEFIAGKWSQKAVLKTTIVQSSTYRQSSTVTPALVERDPHNRLLARGPRVRMEAEMVRDVRLRRAACSARRCTGRACFRCSRRASGTCRTAPTSGPRAKARIVTGAASSPWRRTSPPSFMTFDATSREFCQVRVRTNTPLQALTLMNDPASFEMARALASRMLKETAEAARRARAAHGVVARAVSQCYG